MEWKIRKAYCSLCFHQSHFGSPFPRYTRDVEARIDGLEIHRGIHTWARVRCLRQVTKQQEEDHRLRHGQNIPECQLSFPHAYGWPSAGDHELTFHWKVGKFEDEASKLKTSSPTEIIPPIFLASFSVTKISTIHKIRHEIHKFGLWYPLNKAACWSG